MAARWALGCSWVTLVLLHSTAEEADLSWLCAAGEVFVWRLELHAVAALLRLLVAGDHICN